MNIGSLSSGMLGLHGPVVPTSHPDSVVYAMPPEDVEATLPAEYRKAISLPEISAAVANALGSVLIIGPPGTGKTYQLYGLLRDRRMLAARHLIEQGERVQYYRATSGAWRVEPGREWSAKHIRAIIARDSMVIISESSDIRAARYDRERLSAWCVNQRLLAIDDIGCVRPSDWVLEAVYEITTQRRKNGLQTIYTTNLTPDQLRESFGGAIASRLLGGVVVEMDGNDRRIL